MDFRWVDEEDYDETKHEIIKPPAMMVFVRIKGRSKKDKFTYGALTSKLRKDALTRFKKENRIKRKRTKFAMSEEQLFSFKKKQYEKRKARIQQTPIENLRICRYKDDVGYQIWYVFGENNTPFMKLTLNRDDVDQPYQKAVYIKNKLNTRGIIWFDIISRNDLSETQKVEFQDTFKNALSILF